MKIDESFQEYGEFLKSLSQRDLSGPLLQPQLIIVCKTTEMAKRLLEGLPTSADALLRDEKELFEFGDGTGAACFPLKSGKGILQMFGLLGQGSYGTEPLRITNGIAIRLPSADRQTLRVTVNSENLFGIGRLLEDEDFWWW